MSLDKSISKFTKDWAKRTAQNAPVGKRPRTNSAKALYPKPLNESIEVIPGPEPLIGMNLYGVFVDQGTRYQKAQPFIDKSFDQALDDSEDLLLEGIFNELDNAFDKTFS